MSEEREHKKKRRLTAVVGLTVLASVIVVGVGVSLPRTDAGGFKIVAEASASLAEILRKSPRESGEIDIGVRNLLCAEGLPGFDGASVQASVQLLDEWTRRVRLEIERFLPRYHANPHDFNDSEAFFRVLTLVTVLQQDFGVRYNPAHMDSVNSPKANDAFFADSRDLFLHGILGTQRTGTCVSMPVLYVAVGRRLGYPLKLVTTKGHLFARWEDGKERFNIEGTNEGLNSFPDEYYRHWPFELSEAEIKSGRYLRSLTPREELALFLQTRGMCLKAAGRNAEAKSAWEKSRELAPDWQENCQLSAGLGHLN